MLSRTVAVRRQYGAVDRIWAQHVAASLTAELDSRRRRRRRAVPFFEAVLQHREGDPDPKALVRPSLPGAYHLSPFSLLAVRP